MENEEVFKQAVLAMEEHYGSGCTEEIDAYFRGAIWMRNYFLEKIKQDLENYFN